MPRPREKKSSAPLKTLRIFCEGAKTEPNYIEGYILNFRDKQRASVVKIESTRKNTPVQLVDVAVELKRSAKSIAGDEFWVVYDRESVSKYDDKLHEKAWRRAESNGINVALSNVCFEHWILLHFENSAAPYSCWDNMRTKSNLNKHVRDVLGTDYDKSSSSIFSKIIDRIDDARGRAIANNKAAILSHPKGTMPYQINPFTGVPDLLSAIDEFE